MPKKNIILSDFKKKKGAINTPYTTDLTSILDNEQQPKKYDIPFNPPRMTDIPGNPLNPNINVPELTTMLEDTQRGKYEIPFIPPSIMDTPDTPDTTEAPDFKKEKKTSLQKKIIQASEDTERARIEELKNEARLIKMEQLANDSTHLERLKERAQALVEEKEKLSAKVFSPLEKKSLIEADSFGEALFRTAMFWASGTQQPYSDSYGIPIGEILEKQARENFEQRKTEKDYLFKQYGILQSEIKQNDAAINDYVKTNMEVLRERIAYVRDNTDRATKRYENLVKIQQSADELERKINKGNADYALRVAEQEMKEKQQELDNLYREMKFAADEKERLFNQRMESKKFEQGKTEHSDEMAWKRLEKQLDENYRQQKLVLDQEIFEAKKVNNEKKLAIAEAKLGILHSQAMVRMNKNDPNAALKQRYLELRAKLLEHKYNVAKASRTIRIGKSQLGKEIKLNITSGLKGKALFDKNEQLSRSVNVVRNMKALYDYARGKKGDFVGFITANIPFVGKLTHSNYQALRNSLEFIIKATNRKDVTGGGNVSNYEQALLDAIATVNPGDLNTFTGANIDKIVIMTRIYIDTLIADVQSHTEDNDDQKFYLENLNKIRNGAFKKRNEM